MNCCATAVLTPNPDGGTFPNCTVDSLTTVCGSCTTNVSVIGMCGSNAKPQTDGLRVCTQKSDCATDTKNQECCPVLGYHVCLSAGLATLGGLTCM
jgi:hypothetical protein